MSGSAVAEIYFIAGMMTLILIMSFAAVYFFVRTYRKEKRAKEEAARKKAAQKLAAETEEQQT